MQTFSSIGTFLGVAHSTNHTFATGLWIYRTWKLGKKQGYVSWLTNRLSQPIALESCCSNPQKTRQSLTLQWKKKFLGVVFCGWRHKRGAVFFRL